MERPGQSALYRTEGVHPVGSVAPLSGRAPATSPLLYGEAAHPAPLHSRAYTAQPGIRGSRCIRATIRAMTSRRSDRSSHVRPRPPSGRRPEPKKIPLKTPQRYRSTVLRHERSKRSLPLPARFLLAVAVAALGVVVFAAATGGIGALATILSRSFSHFFDGIMATPSPSPTAVIVSDSPLIKPPTEPYTNHATIDLDLTLPSDLVGDPNAKIRMYLALEGQSAAAIDERPVGATPRMIFPVELTPGRNDFSATIIDGDTESEPSPIVTFILDTDAPPITITSPKNGSTVNADTVTLKGSTQGRSSIGARNDANGISVVGTAESDGTFAVTLPLEPGPNSIKIAITDPAGNRAEVAFTAVRGSGTLTATLSSSAYRISAAGLPATIQLAVLVVNPDGQPLDGASVTFSLTVPGIPPITFDTTTGGDGRAAFSTTLPQSVTPGAGNATVLITTTSFGTTSDQVGITIVP